MKKNWYKIIGLIILKVIAALIILSILGMCSR